MREKFYQILKFLFAVSCIVLWIWAMFSTPGEREKMAFSDILLLWCVFAIVMVQLRWKFEQKNGYSTVTKVIALILISLLIAKEYYVRFII